MAQENQNNSQFGERMSVEQFLSRTNAKTIKVYPRVDEKGNPIYGHTDGVEDKTKPLYYFATENMLGYVPSALGQKMAKGEGLGDLFISEVQTPGYAEPMFMLCESKREAVWGFSLD